VEDETPQIVAAGAGLFPLLLAKHFFLGGGLGEELGWRGFLLPRLQARSGALRASVMIGVAWGLWHAPAFWLPGTGKEGDFITMGLFTLLTVGLSVIFTRVHNATGASLLIVSVLHAAFNSTENALEAVIPALDGSGATMIYGVAVLVVAALLALFTRGRLGAP
jgi:membrane protease YdiL (CAAX protease family)